MKVLRLALAATLLTSAMTSHAEYEKPCPDSWGFLTSDGKATCSASEAAYSYGEHVSKIREADYVKAHAKGDTEVVLKDGTRADEVTGTHAIEYKWARNWKDAVGQALHYAHMTQKRAGIVLICKTPADIDKAFNIIAMKLPITVWVATDLNTPIKQLSKR